MLNIGRFFYGIAIAGIGLLMIYYQEFPYMLFLIQPWLIPGLVYLTGILFILAGAAIISEKKIRPVSFFFGCILLLIFCFNHLPYEFGAGSNYKNLLEWDNAGKELAMAGGAFIIAACFSEKNKNTLDRFQERILPFGSVLFSLPIVFFGVLHLLYAKDVATMVPSWIFGPVFWTYFAGIALLGSGISIILKIRTTMIATLLGTMIFFWFVFLHLARVINSPITELESEVTSAFLALAYSGTAFVVAGAARNFD
jgi:uncharacterized membrane protein YphA (DoxX/SURF4 family)